MFTDHLKKAEKAGTRSGGGSGNMHRWVMFGFMSSSVLSDGVPLTEKPETATTAKSQDLGIIGPAISPTVTLNWIFVSAGVR